MRKKVKFSEVRQGQTFRYLHEYTKETPEKASMCFALETEVEIEVPSVTFGELAVGERFVYNEKQFKKIVPFVAFTEHSEANAVRSDDVVFYICLGAIVERLP